MITAINEQAECLRIKCSPNFEYEYYLSKPCIDPTLEHYLKVHVPLSSYSKLGEHFILNIQHVH